jgi:hypothetical protein
LAGDRRDEAIAAMVAMLVLASDPAPGRLLVDM